MAQNSEDHSAQTKAKLKEQAILAGPAPTGIGRRCKICQENLWHKEFYPHMDRHLDAMNDFSNELPMLELESFKSENA